jgi:hypothetical protein
MWVKTSRLWRGGCQLYTNDKLNIAHQFLALDSQQKLKSFYDVSAATLQTVFSAAFALRPIEGRPSVKTQTGAETTVANLGLSFVKGGFSAAAALTSIVPFSVVATLVPVVKDAADAALQSISQAQFDAFHERCAKLIDPDQISAFAHAYALAVTLTLGPWIVSDDQSGLHIKRNLLQKGTSAAKSKATRSIFNPASDKLASNQLSASRVKSSKLPNFSRDAAAEKPSSNLFKSFLGRFSKKTTATTVATATEGPSRNPAAADLSSTQKDPLHEFAQNLAIHMIESLLALDELPKRSSDPSKLDFQSILEAMLENFCAKPAAFKGLKFPQGLNSIPYAPHLILFQPQGAQALQAIHEEVSAFIEKQGIDPTSLSAASSVQGSPNIRNSNLDSDSEGDQASLNHLDDLAVAIEKKPKTFEKRIEDLERVNNKLIAENNDKNTKISMLESDVERLQSQLQNIQSLLNINTANSVSSETSSA